MSKTFIISDTHFNHGNIIKYTNRPFTGIRHMNESMIHYWNETVGKNDLVYHLGDFAFSDQRNMMKLVESLNGRIIIIRGNHDRRGTGWLLECGFQEVHNILEIGPYILSHWPVSVSGINDKINFHGHTHNRILNSNKHKNFCVEVVNYRPVRFDFSKGIWGFDGSIQEFKL